MNNRLKRILIMFLAVLAFWASTCQFLGVLAEINNSPKITIAYGQKSATFYPQKYKAQSKVFTHKYSEQQFYRSGDIKQKINMLKLIKSQGWSSYDAFKFMFAGLNDDIERWLILNVNTPPQNAKLIFRPNNSVKFAIIKEKNGQRADIQKLFDDIYQKMLTSTTVKVTAHTLPILPEITADYLKQETYLRASFSTGYASSSAGRKHNIQLAMKRFNGLVVRHGEIVSFNKVVGPRTAYNGFVEAKIIMGGRYEQGIGGGVCQASTTVYNAALLADMEIISANNHSLRVSYIEPSFDAMVNGSWSDLKFRNNTGRNVYIHSYCAQNRVVVEFYGLKMPYRITRRYKILSRIASPGSDKILDYDGKYSKYVKYKGQTHILQHPKDGMVSEGYLRYYSGDKLLKEVKIRNDRYAPQRGLIVEGVQSPPPPEEQEQKLQESASENNQLFDFSKIFKGFEDILR
ncbi:MAG: VanW family protein [Clostridiales bacterium]|nr:VanW family protein [Clostridiales bacterium]